MAITPNCSLQRHKRKGLLSTLQPYYIIPMMTFFGPWIVHCVCTMVHMRQKTHFLKKIVLLHPFHFKEEERKRDGMSVD